MDRNSIIHARDELVRTLSGTGDLLRGSLVVRTIWTRGLSYRSYVLSVTYAPGRVRQFSVRREQVPEVRRYLANYQKLKQTVETICEFNRELLRAEGPRRRARGSGKRLIQSGK